MTYRCRELLCRVFPGVPQLPSEDQHPLIAVRQDIANRVEYMTSLPHDGHVNRGIVSGATAVDRYVHVKAVVLCSPTVQYTATSVQLPRSACSLLDVAGLTAQLWLSIVTSTPVAWPANLIVRLRGPLRQVPSGRVDPVVDHALVRLRRQLPAAAAAHAVPTQASDARSRCTRRPSHRVTAAPADARSPLLARWIVNTRRAVIVIAIGSDDVRTSVSTARVVAVQSQRR